MRRAKRRAHARRSVALGERCWPASSPVRHAAYVGFWLAERVWTESSIHRSGRLSVGCGVRRKWEQTFATVASRPGAGVRATCCQSRFGLRNRRSVSMIEGPGATLQRTVAVVRSCARERPATVSRACADSSWSRSEASGSSRRRRRRCRPRGSFMTAASPSQRPSCFRIHSKEEAGRTASPAPAAGFATRRRAEASIGDTSSRQAPAYQLSGAAARCSTRTGGTARPRVP